MSELDELKSKFRAVMERVDSACERAGRSSADVTLVAVSKTHPAEMIRALYEEGHRHFGENYVQEWQDKRDFLPADICWHFIGHLQSNKARYIADDMHLIHSVDRKSVMKKLNRRSDAKVDVLLQVNTGNDQAKGGVDPDGLPALLEGMVDNYPSLVPRGVMTIPPFGEPIETTRGHFSDLRETFETARAWVEEHHPELLDGFEHISMGMTADFEEAIEEGATIVRVGTAIFGARD